MTMTSADQWRARGRYYAGLPVLAVMGFQAFVRGERIPLLGWIDLSGFLRVVTHARIFRDPTPLTVALEFVQALRETPNSIVISPGQRHWELFQRLLVESDARGNLVPDAWLAALCMEQGATWYSADGGFARFPGLDGRHPLG